MKTICRVGLTVLCCVGLLCADDKTKKKDPPVRVPETSTLLILASELAALAALFPVLGRKARKWNPGAPEVPTAIPLPLHFRPTALPKKARFSDSGP